MNDRLTFKDNELLQTTHTQHDTRMLYDLSINQSISSLFLIATQMTFEGCYCPLIIIDGLFFKKKKIQLSLLGHRGGAISRNFHS
jgi:hypothetical protein